nr:hypothetical protein [Tanacetum cinerariifolium]
MLFVRLVDFSLCWLTLPDDYHNIIDFWTSSHIRAPELGPPPILATIDRTPYTITEDLVRTDDEGVANLPIPEIYSGMDNLGYGKINLFQIQIFTSMEVFSPYPTSLSQPQVRQLGSIWELYATFTCYASPSSSRPQSSNPVAPVLRHDHSSDQHKTTTGSFPTREDAPLGGNFHTSPTRSSHAPPTGQPSGGVEDPITLTALSSVVSTLVQKVHSLEAELHDHKKLFKDVVRKLVKKVKTLDVKLKTQKRKMVVKERQNRPLTSEQQKAYMRQYFKN